MVMLTNSTMGADMGIDSVYADSSRVNNGRTISVPVRFLTGAALNGGRASCTPGRLARRPPPNAAAAYDFAESEVRVQAFQ